MGRSGVTYHDVAQAARTRSKLYINEGPSGVNLG